MSTFVCPKLKLMYFDIPGLAEPIRLLTLGREDIRLNEEAFEHAKEEGKFPYKQVPVLIINDAITIAQSAAILRFVGKFAGLYPIDDALLAARIDALLDVDKDLGTGLPLTSEWRKDYGFGKLSDETAKEIRQDLGENYIPSKLQLLEHHLTTSHTGWLLGTPKPTIADFVVANRLRTFTEGIYDGVSKDILAPFTHLLAFKDKFYSLPSVHAYYEAKASK
eukprot:gene26668-32226_t